MFWNGVSVLSVPNIKFKNMLKGAVMANKDMIGWLPCGLEGAMQWAAGPGERPRRPHRGEGAASFPQSIAAATSSLCGRLHAVVLVFWLVLRV